ncbi:sulfatase [Tautonia marina]|uniref:sulfatase n=1 Tax=Tautonia marina TaxID=2653855 RepID=UPI0013754860|nr:sulfatase [Tautonia marina]
MQDGSPTAQVVGPGPIGLLILAAWLGLLAGAGELAAFLFVRARSGEVWPYLGKIRAYPWTIPTVNAALLLVIAVPIAVLTVRSPRLGNRIGPHLLVAFAFLPTLLVLGPGLYLGALLILALGGASIVVPIARRHPQTIARMVRSTVPVLLLGLVGLAFWRHASPQPVTEPSDRVRAPSVLLIVLDTVRADHLSLPGSGAARQTSPELETLAARGVTFTGARATAPWTLPSHASLMTGRWSFDVCLGRFGAMSDDGPTLAGSLASIGYDTVGIVANTYYTTYATGLSRGFAHYEDLPMNLATILASTEVGGRLIDLIGRLSTSLRPNEPPPLVRFDRIDAGSINRRFLHWLDHDRAEDRPFFAFLNYFDAHDPYLVPPGTDHRFGEAPTNPADRAFLKDWWLRSNKSEITPEQEALLIDGYDSCIASLDQHLGRLFRELDRRALLDELIVVVTSDHGEAFGEHDLFGHGVSLYEDQLHVPLLMVAPGLAPKGQVIDRVVSLRDVPATLLDLVGHPDAPLPGISLASLWEPAEDRTPGEGSFLNAEVPSPAVASVPGPDMFLPNEGKSPVFGGPMISIMDDRHLKYIRTERSPVAVEELYAVGSDPNETFNLVSPSSMPLLDQLRSTLMDRVQSDRSE